jgi:hypothetical protein
LIIASFLIAAFAEVPPMPHSYVILVWVISTLLLATSVGLMVTYILCLNESLYRYTIIGILIYLTTIFTFALLATSPIF